MTDRTRQPTGCATCDMHGPELPASLNLAALDVHRAWHHAGREVTALLKPTVDWLANLLGRPLGSATGARSAEQGSDGDADGCDVPDAAQSRLAPGTPEWGDWVQQIINGTGANAEDLARYFDTTPSARQHDHEEERP